ncbi:MAG: SDR family oxidoreductase [Bacteroidetes bacterium]|nr:SDR family oxidoreductase [Bacteroidota bacterium]
MNIFSLTGKIVVITGASGLLGREHAKAILTAGGIPILLDINLQNLEELAKELNTTFNVEIPYYLVDITNEDAVMTNARDIKDRFGKIDGLVNNAANNPKVENSSEKNFSRLEFFSSEVWNKDLAVGLTGAFLCTKHYGYIISQNPDGGSIVNISSDLGIIAPDQRLYSIPGLPDHLQPVKPVTYSVVKTGLIGLTKYISTYWVDKNVRCNVICPGGVENNQDSAFISELIKRIPMGRMAQKDEYHGVLIFLLSNASVYMTGAILSVDGGRTAW